MTEEIYVLARTTDSIESFFMRFRAGRPLPTLDIKLAKTFKSKEAADKYSESRGISTMKMPYLPRKI